MNHMRLWTAATIIAIFIFIGFVLSVPRASDGPSVPLTEEEASVPSVTLQDVFRRGTHTITASLFAPNACATLTASSTLQGNASSTESILVAITLATDTGVCLQVPTLMKVSTTVVAPADIPITASVNGVMASTTES